MYGLLLINKNDGCMVVLTVPTGVRVWATKNEAVNYGIEVYGKDNPHVAYQAVAICHPVGDSPTADGDECDECGHVIPETGGSLANKYHRSDCSLYDPKGE